MPLGSTNVIHPTRTDAVAAMVDRTKPQTAVISRRTWTRSASGGDVEVMVVVASGVPCRIRKQGKRVLEATAGAQTDEVARYDLSFPNGTDVQAVTDRVYVGTRTFDVLEAGFDSYEAEARTLCAEVTT